MADPHSTDVPKARKPYARKPYTGPMTIYLLTNTVNGKYYVGQTVRNAAHRWSVHKCEARKPRSTSGYLHKAIRKYGEDAFLVETLAITTDFDELNRLEELWILVLDAMNPAVGYNGAHGGRNHRPTPAAVEKRAAFFRGRPLSAEHRAKVGRPGRRQSIEHRAHRSAALKGRRPSPETLAAVALANTRRSVSPETSAKLRAAAIKANDVRWARQRLLNVK